MPRSGEKSGIGGQGGEINRVENVENVEWGVRGRPMVGAAVPCRPHGFGRGDQENVERGFRQDLQDGGNGTSGTTGTSGTVADVASVAVVPCGVLRGRGAGGARPSPSSRSPRPIPCGRQGTAAPTLGTTHGHQNRILSILSKTPPVHIFYIPYAVNPPFLPTPTPRFSPFLDRGDVCYSRFLALFAHL